MLGYNFDALGYLYCVDIGLGFNYHHVGCHVQPVFVFTTHLDDNVRKDRAHCTSKSTSDVKNTLGVP